MSRRLLRLLLVMHSWTWVEVTRPQVKVTRPQGKVTCPQVKATRPQVKATRPQAAAGVGKSASMEESASKRARHDGMYCPPLCCNAGDRKGEVRTTSTQRDPAVLADQASSPCWQLLGAAAAALSRTGSWGGRDA